MELNRIQVYNPYTNLYYFLRGGHRNKEEAESRIKLIIREISITHTCWTLTNKAESTKEYISSAELNKCIFSIVLKEK